jgi:RNA polymerase sigma-70 factor (ECF subfamily)
MEAVLMSGRPALPAARRVASISDVTNRELTDGELLERVGAGDRDAFDELYRRYTRPVLGLALRRLRDRGRAEDAVQDAFAAVWRSARSYDPERGAGAAWLYTVARNAIVDGVRRRPEPPAGVVVEEAASGAGPEERAEASWLAWRVHRAIEDLPEHEREVLELAYWSELSQSEIAERLHVPLGTVKTRTRTGLARLADALEGELR